jgi:hypothetical protein
VTRDPKAWFKMFQDDTVSSQRIIATIAEKKIQLAPFCNRGAGGMAENPK